MSKKIKEIDITAFRAYKDVQKFDFIHKNSGNIANLVAIYAPNGYGKTSFFDAVEWAVTGTIVLTMLTLLFNIRVLFHKSVHFSISRMYNIV